MPVPRQHDQADVPRRRREAEEILDELIRLTEESKVLSGRAQKPQRPASQAPNSKKDSGE